jgi:energy-coupling factor transport system substrate-specific component
VKSLRTWVAIGVIGGLAGALRVPFAFAPGIQPSTALIILAGQAMGPIVGLGVGIMTPLVSNTLLGHGPWTIFQALAWGLVGYASGLLPRTHRWWLTLWGVVSSLLFGLIMDLSTWILFAERTWSTLIFTLARGLPFNIAHAAATATVLAAAGPRLSALLTRGRIRILGRGGRTLRPQARAQTSSEPAG